MPLIKTDTGSVLITLYSSIKTEEYTTKILTARQKIILNYIKEEGLLTTSQCANLLNTSQDTVLRELTELKRRSLIKRKGIGRGVHYIYK